MLNHPITPAPTFGTTKLTKPRLPRDPLPRTAKRKQISTAAPIATDGCALDELLDAATPLVLAILAEGEEARCSRPGAWRVNESP